MADIALDVQSAPTTPAAGVAVVYVDTTTKKLASKDDAGTVTAYSAGVTLPVSVADGGTGLTSGTSGGIPAYTASGTIASSAALAATKLVVGGGAGVVPFTDTNWAIEQTGHSLSSTTQPRAVVYNSSTQSINDSTYTAITFDSEDLDVGGLHSTVSNTSRLTVPTGCDGFYLVMGSLDFASNSVGVRGGQIFKNGATELIYEQSVMAGTASIIILHIMWLGNLVATDYVELRAFQSSGGALNVGNATRSLSNSFSITKLW